MLVDLALQPKQMDIARHVWAEGENAPTKLGFGGPRAGGKSGGIRRLMLGRRMKLPGTVGFIVQRTFPKLYENHIVRFRQEWPEFNDVYNVQNKEYALPNGSRIAFKHCEHPHDVEEFSRGPEAMDIFVEQAEQFTEKELQMLSTPNRSPGAPMGRCKTGYFFNPGGPGTEYLRRIFWTRKFQKQETPEDFAFVRACGWDNFEWFRGQVPIDIHEFYAMPELCWLCDRDLKTREDGVRDCCRFQLFITSTTEGRKLNGLTPSLRMGELLGSFERFSGQYYAGVWDENTCVISPSEADRLIQPWWTRWVSTDWGFAHHCCHLWFASGKLSPDQFKKFFGQDAEWPVEVVVCYRELVTSETAEDDLARQMVSMTPPSERPLIRDHWLSPDAWAKRGSANTVADQFLPILRAAGLPGPDRADDDRVGGWRLLYQGFKQAGAFRSSKVTKEMAQVGPMLLISANCPEVMGSVPLLIRDEDNLEDVLKTPSLADDVGDSLRYGYKSQIDPRSKAPRDARAKEVYDSFVGETAETMTNRALAMKKFAVEERKTTRVGRPRWR